MTEADRSLFSVEVGAKVRRLQHVALWKWWVLLHPIVISSLCAIVILV